MTVPKTKFLLSMEQECMCVVPGTDDPSAIDFALRELLTTIRDSVPCLGGGGGLFNGYGRIYVDSGQHLELAAAECDSPYSLVSIVETQQQIVSRALARNASAGVPLRLANNNHSGLLSSSTETWGAHENFLVTRHPSSFGNLILPFLVTRIYAGAGGVRHPSGDFLAAVRPEFMRGTTGGGTTQDRAIHSTSREEHHAPGHTGLFRYHLILGDGHRSQFSLALQYGATALVLKVIEHAPGAIERRLADLRPVRNGRLWVRTLNDFNLLARVGDVPSVDPMVIDVQRAYLDAVTELYGSESTEPEWIARLLEDWRDTLAALETMDLVWLSARLDAFIKYELFTAVLAESGRTWRNLLEFPAAFNELALIDHSYHEFGNPDSTFDHLDRLGVLQQRVSERTTPGAEREPYVPALQTRARARARFISEHAGKRGYFVDWAGGYDRPNNRHLDLSDPFALEYRPVRAPAVPEE